MQNKHGHLFLCAGECAHDAIYMTSTTATDDSIKPVVVFGGTGHYGQEIVRHLVEKQGVSVRVLTRNAEKARSMFQNDAVEIVVGDVTCQTTIQETLMGSRGVVITLSAMNPQQIRQQTLIERDAVFSIVEEMKQQEISKLVYISGYDIKEDLLRSLHIESFGAIKVEVEQYIQQQCSNLDWTILGCPPSYEIFFAMLRDDKMFVPGGGNCAIPCISAQDVGAIAAQVAASGENGWTHHRRIRMCGPEATTFPEMARRMSHHTGKEIHVVNIPLWLINIASFVAQPCYPMMRFLYFGLKMLNNFPADLASQVPEDHSILVDNFDYEPVTLDMEIQRRLP